ncbi:MAG: hypothetical protein MUC50_09325 [Myxococcota bacterium]|nr:hypothetical protein [Myxococcota bacterium]
MGQKLSNVLIVVLGALLVANLGATAYLWSRLSTVEAKAKKLKDRLAEFDPGQENDEGARLRRTAELGSSEDLQKLRSALLAARERSRIEEASPPQKEPEKSAAEPESEAMAEFAAMNEAAGGKRVGKGRIPFEQLAADLDLSPRQSSDLRDIINEARKGLYELYQAALERKKVPYIRLFNELKDKTDSDLRLILSPQQHQKFTDMRLGVFAVETGYRPFEKKKISP